jgi:hypothetical protein
VVLPYPTGAQIKVNGIIESLEQAQAIDQASWNQGLMQLGLQKDLILIRHPFEKTL